MSTAAHAPHDSAHIQAIGITSTDDHALVSLLIHKYTNGSLYIQNLSVHMNHNSKIVHIVF